MKLNTRRSLLRLFALYSFLLIVAVSATILNAQKPYHFDHYTIQNGLSHNSLFCLYQDSKGFLWIGADHGVSRFDGTNFVKYYSTYSDTASLLSDAVLNIVEDTLGHLWFRHLDGFTMMETESGEMRRFSDAHHVEELHGIKMGLFTRMFRDGMLRTVSVETKELCVLNELSGVLHSYSLDSLIALAGGRPGDYKEASFLERPDGSWWFMYDQGLIHFSGSNAPLRWYACNGNMMSLVRRQDTVTDPFFAGWETGLYRQMEDGSATRFFNLESSIRLSNVVYAILEPEREQLWVGTQAGLFSVDSRTGAFTTIRFSRESETPIAVADLLQDRQDNIWIATEDGLYHMDPRTQGFHYVQVADKANQAYENPIYDVVEGEHNHELFIVSREGHVYISTAQGVHDIKLDTQDFGLNEDPNKLFRDADGVWWLLTRYKVYNFDPDTYQLTEVDVPQRREGRRGLIWAVAEDQSNRLWFGLSRDGVFLLDRKTKASRYLSCEEDGLCALTVTDIHIDTLNNKVWVSTEGDGLWESDGDPIAFRRIGPENSALPSDRIDQMDQDRYGHLWMGTSAGICRYDWRQNLFYTLNVKHGLPFPDVSGITYDGTDHIWGGSASCLISIDIHNFDIDVYDHRYGVDVTPVPMYNITRGGSGMMYAGGKTGYLYWRPSTLLRDTAIASVYLTNIEIMGSHRAVPEQGSLELKYHEHTITLSFSSIDFTFPERNRYMWKLTGFDEDWHIGQSPAMYTRIPPGEYHFTVAPIGHEDRGIHTIIKVLPTFWQTWWFKALGAAFILGILVSLYRWRIRLIREKEAIKSQLLHRIAEIEMTALRAQINPHFIFNCLNSINKFIQINDPDTASLYLTKFSRLIRMALDLSRENMVRFDKELEMIRTYIELESMRFDGRFTWFITVDPYIDPSCIEIPPMVLQPYIENAIWHGLMNKEGNSGKLQISITTVDRDLIVQIEDNGVGRMKAAELKSKNATKHKSQGMALTKERLDIVRQQTGKQIALTVNDLVLPDGTPGGTSVTMTFLNYES